MNKLFARNLQDPPKEEKLVVSQTEEMQLSQKNAREKCWIGRDKYFECLDAEKSNCTLFVLISCYFYNS